MKETITAHVRTAAVLSGLFSLFAGSQSAFAAQAAHHAAPAASPAAPAATKPSAQTSTTTPASAGAMLLKGEVALSSFPVSPTQLRVVSGKAPIAEATLGPDGKFNLKVPSGLGYQIELTAGGTTYALVFPRGGSTVEKSFAVQGKHEPFDLGLVQYVASAAKEQFVVNHRTPDEKDSTQCAFGKICIDDVEAAEDVCGPTFGEAAAPAASATTTTTEAVPGPSAVAERNLPATVGCGDDEPTVR